MRVLLVFNHEKVIGGGEIYFMEYVKALKKYQDRIKLAVFTPGEGEIKKELENENIKHFSFSMPSAKNIIHTNKTLKNFQDMLYEFRPDIIHVNGSRAMLYLTLLKAKLMLKKKGNENQKFKLIWHVRISQKDKIDLPLFIFCDGIIVNSRKTLIKRFSYITKFIRNKKIKVIYNGIDLSLKEKVSDIIKKGKRDELKKELKIQGLVISSYGRIEEGKGFDLLVRAAKKIKQNRKFSILIAGEGPLKEKILKMGKGLNIISPGFMKKEEILALSDIVVFPSCVDSFGNVVLEALACGIPQIVSSHAGASEIVENFKEAIIVDPKKIDEFSHKIELLINNEDLRKKLSENSIRKAPEFSIENHRKQVLEFYKIILEQN
jgi:glycosyltransferase involved in cell wall biosynthesis